MDEKNQRTLYCGNLSEKITEGILYELFLQAGPLESVTIPKAPDGRKKNFAFVTFKHEVSVPYTIALMNGIQLYGRPIRLELRTGIAKDNPFMEALDKHHRSLSCPGMVSHGYNSRVDMRGNHPGQMYENGMDHRGMANRYQERYKNDYSRDYVSQRFVHDYRAGYDTNFNQLSLDLLRHPQSQHVHFQPFGRIQ